ncbi:MAG: hypothetical protein AAF961_01225 [Planctomycetota bacterium]
MSESAPNSDLDSAILTAAVEPAAASGDEGSVSARKIGELIEAERHVAGKRAVRSRHRGLYITKLSPPGTA